MGSAIGACLADTGHHVVWASAGRSAATAQRAIDAGLVDVGTVDRLVAECHVVFSVCPPHAAAEVVRAIHDFRGTFVEANAISPRTARQIAAAVNGQGASVVDGGIIGPPPGSTTPGGTRFYLAGPEAATVAGLFDSTPVDARIVEGELGAASALKMTYAAWTKGSVALLLAIRAVARATDVEQVLLTEWERSQPGLTGRSLQAERSAATKAGGGSPRWRRSPRHSPTLVSRAVFIAPPLRFIGVPLTSMRTTAPSGIDSRRRPGPGGGRHRWAVIPVRRRCVTRAGPPPSR
jgi:3-hydroxyisobutyrate dehydrogenase-like beta-hydroxyacid dehydrogenase